MVNQAQRDFFDQLTEAAIHPGTSLPDAIALLTAIHGAENVGAALTEEHWKNLLHATEALAHIMKLYADHLQVAHLPNFEEPTNGPEPDGPPPQPNGTNHASRTPSMV